jgi:hypothetical protein
MWEISTDGRRWEKTSQFFDNHHAAEWGAKYGFKVREFPSERDVRLDLPLRYGLPVEP